LISRRETSVLGKRGDITRAMQNANDHEIALVVHIVDSISAGEPDP